MQVYKDKDLKKNVLVGAPIAVLGYGNQGHAHALNLRDSGADVIVGARPNGDSAHRAAGDGFRCAGIGEAVAQAACVAVLLPDEVQGQVFESEIRVHLRPEATLVFAHGFGVAFGVLSPPVGHDVVLVAPKGQGHYVRRMYVRGQGVPCLIGVESDASDSALDKALSYADLLGCLRAGAIETSFREEAVTDLFGEQTVLCGGVPALVKAAFDTLVEAGYDPAIAYIECLHELKIVTDLMHRGGISAMRDKISRTAAWGSFQAERDIDTAELRSAMQRILQSIESGAFARAWCDETEHGQRQLHDHIVNEAHHPIEEAGRSVRALIQHLKEED